MEEKQQVRANRIQQIKRETTPSFRPYFPTKVNLHSVSPLKHTPPKSPKAVVRKPPN
jgi:hypothetical protein